MTKKRYNDIIKKLAKNKKEEGKMLQTVNLTKIYKTKKGVTVKALDNVSLTLPDKGMVFVLGKSGSGKSTFLNVLGGLDSMDGGEIIIKGKSAKTFKQSDYDSYRNTYIGFIFQEYNVLEEFSVGANIALALELQGKKADNATINKILKDVDLDGYGARKPNELSGGQKQRVAIARALVKNPEIIMADEPTGALDSTTGKQIFDTLKRLSKEKLVIVVSHDRDFAETYADRIIEFSDGVVISDVERENNSKEEEYSPKLTFDGDTVSISGDYRLTEEDRIKINEYLNAYNADDKVKLKIFNSSSCVKTQNTFRPTNQKAIIHNDKETYKAIKSKLHLKNSFKIGASGLKIKPVRLVFTILLSFIAFTLFGLADTLGAYNKYDAFTNSISDSNIEFLSISKNNLQRDEHSDYIYEQLTKLNDNDIAKLKEKTGIDFKGIYSGVSGNIYYNNNIGPKSMGTSDNYWWDYFRGFMEINQNELSSYGYALLAGKLPEKGVSSEYKEIAVSEYVYKVFERYKYKDYNSGEEQTISSYNDLLNKNIVLEENIYKIVGIINTKFDFNRYDKLLNYQENAGYGIDIMLLGQEYDSLLNYGPYILAFIAEDDYSTSNNFNNININEYGSLEIQFEDRYDMVSEVAKFDANWSAEIMWLGETKENLAENEIIITQQIFDNLFNDKINEMIDKIQLNNEDKVINYETFADIFYGDATQYYVIKYATDYIEEACENGFLNYIDIPDYNLETNRQEIIMLYVDYINSGYNINEFGKETYESIANNSYSKLNELKSKYIAMNLNDLTINLNYTDYYSNKDMEQKTCKIVGYLSSNDGKPIYYTNLILVNDTYYNELLNGREVGNYNLVMGLMPEDESALKELSKIHYDKSGNVSYVVKNSVTNSLDMVNDMLETMGQVFLYIGIGFAVFAAIMLSNFIATSISYKKVEIGILRAIGSRGNDVFRIFFAESFIVAMINFVLSAVATFIVTFIINDVIRNDYGVLITILNFGLRQIGLLLVVSLGVAFIASFLPVKKIASKKPIDAIRNR